MKIIYLGLCCEQFSMLHPFSAPKPNFRFTHTAAAATAAASKIKLKEITFDPNNYTH
jgi:hypothetical protein